MKKSQILAALALAFALGVVAPVAGIATNVSAYSDAKGTATYGDTTNAIAYAENTATYKAYVKLQDAIRTYNANPSKYADLAVVSGDNTSSSARSVDADVTIYNAIAAAQRATSGFGYNLTNIANSISSEDVLTNQIGAAIAAANTSDLYKVYSKLASVLADNKATDAQLQSAVTAIRTTLGWSDGGVVKSGLGMFSKQDYEDLHPEEATLAVYRSKNITWTGYAEAKDVYDAIVNAEDAVAKYNAGINLFMPWMVNTADFMTEGAKNIVNDKINLQPSYLKAVAGNSANFNRIAQLSDLYDEVQDAKSDRVSEESGDNYTIINKLAVAWKAATGSEENTKVVMARMAAYKASSNGEVDNNGDINVKPGNTGALNSAAEGTASTTVSIVAGLATALTALGAGVVAYRNARRSN